MKTSKHIFYDISAKNGCTLGHQYMRLYYTKKELKCDPKGTHRLPFRSKKHHKNNMLQIDAEPAAGTTCWVIINLKQ